MVRVRPYTNRTGVLIRIGNLDTQRNPGMHAHTEGRSHENTVQRQPSASQGKRPPKKPTLLTF